MVLSVTTEVGAGKTLGNVYRRTGNEAFGMAHKPMIIGLKSNVHEIARSPTALLTHTPKSCFRAKKILHHKTSADFGDIKITIGTTI